MSFGGWGTRAVHRPELGERGCFFSMVGSGPWTPTAEVFLLLRTTLRTRTPTVSGVLPCTFPPTWDGAAAPSLLLQQPRLRGCLALLHRDRAEKEGIWDWRKGLTLSFHSVLSLFVFLIADAGFVYLVDISVKNSYSKAIPFYLRVPEFPNYSKPGGRGFSLSIS